MELRCACCYFLTTVAVGVVFFSNSVIAQISSDGTLSTTVSTDDAVNFLIEGGERSLDNLFHSFSEFSIPNLGSAYFNNATDITNIFSRVTEDGGNIDIQTSLIVGLENSRINANAVTGNGGNITITAQGLFFSPDSSITASSEFGIDGVVEINTPDEENKLAIAQLPVNLTDASEQIVGNCSWTRDNTFYVVGRRGIAKTPQEHIQDYTMWSDIRDFNQAEGIRQGARGSGENPRRRKTQGNAHQERREEQERIIEANAWIINERGNVELVAVMPSNNQNLGQVASNCSGEVGS